MRRNMSRYCAKKHVPLETLEQFLDTLICYAQPNGDVLVKIRYQNDKVPGNLTLGDITNEIENLLFGHIGKIRIPRERKKKTASF